MHRAGALSSYNACREGFVFSDGGTIVLPEAAGCAGDGDILRVGAGGRARVLAEIERRLQIPSGWFEANFGPLGDNAQWHRKRHVAAGASPHAVTAARSACRWRALGPVDHQRRAHDRPGTNAGALGLECMRRGGGWDEVGGHGHGVATVLCGSVLQKVTGGAFGGAPPRDDARRRDGGRRARPRRRHLLLPPAPDACAAARDAGKAGSAVTLARGRSASPAGTAATPSPRRSEGRRRGQEGEPDG